MFRKIFFLVLLVAIISCDEDKPQNLVPDKLSAAPNYWCTWYWQNYMIKAGEPVTNPSGREVYSNKAAREQMNYNRILGENGWARVMLPKSRGEYYFLIDHGWQDKSVKKNTFFSFIMDGNDFPKYAGLEPKERIKKLNEEIKALGWRGLGLWVRGTPTREDARKFVEWSKYAGIEYWKIDGGDTKNFLTYKVKNEIYPELTLEYVTGTGPLNPDWDKPDLKEYPSVYYPGDQQLKDGSAEPGHASRALRVISNSDVFRTYDAVPLLVSTVTLQRIHDILSQTAGDGKYRAFLNIQDDCNIAAALGCVVAVKRHPMKTPRMFEGRDFHFQIAGDRHVDKRLNEMDRLVRWQRIAPPMNAGYGTYSYSDKYLIDKYVFRVGDTWKEETWGKMVTQGAPAIMARNIPLPKVEIDGEPPYVMASKFKNGAICIATEGRVKPEESWYHPRANILIEVDDAKEPIGVFGRYSSLTLELNSPVDENAVILAQDLLAEKAVDISKEVKIKDNRIIIPGDLIDRVGTMAATEGDISVPGLVIQIK